MTTLLDGELSAPAEPAGRSRRFKVLTTLIAIVLLGGIGTGIGWIIYTQTYQPLELGPFGAEPLGAVREVTDGITTPTADIVTGPKGSTGTVVLTLDNDGRHSIRILSLDTGVEGLNFGERWIAMAPQGFPYNSITGSFAHSAAFPATIPPHEEIAVFVTVTKPGCSPGTAYGIGRLEFHDVALGVHHTWPLELQAGDDQDLAPIYLCSPHAALSHLAKE